MSSRRCRRARCWPTCWAATSSGLAVALFALRPELPAEWRLFVITGFLGGLTTFSTFSAEVVHALQAGRTGWALATVATHVLGSLALTLAGLATPALFRQ